MSAPRRTRTNRSPRLEPAADPRPPELGGWRSRALPVFALFGAAIALYFACLGYGTVLDDEVVITKNSFVQQGLGGLRDIFAHDSFVGYSQRDLFLLEGGRYRPLSLATFAVERAVLGPDRPQVSHLINVLLYALTALVLFWLLRRWFPGAAERSWYSSLPFLAALIFVVHPLHVEAVANIKGRDEILALLGGLAALLSSFRYLDTKRVRWLWSASFCFFLGLLAKESAVTFLAVIPLSFWTFGRTTRTRALALSAPLWIAFLAYAALRIHALGYFVGHGRPVTDLINNPFLGMSWGDRYATILMTLGWYAKLLFIPHPLTSDYYPYHVPAISWADWRAIASLALYLGLVTWALIHIRKRQLAAYCVLYFVITLSIVSNLLIQVGTFMNERFLFMPSVGFCLWLAWGLSEQVPAWCRAATLRRTLPTALTIAVIGFFSWLTIARVPAWKDALSLHSAAVAVSENSARAHLFYATSLYQAVYQKATDRTEKSRLVDTLEHHLGRALAIHPRYGAAWMMRAVVALARFELDKDQAKMFGMLDDTIVAIPYHPDFRRLIDQYLRFLAANGGDPNLILSYAYRNGYERFFRERHDVESAKQLLLCGLATGVEDRRLLSALAEVSRAVGNIGEAEAFEARAQKNAVVFGDSPRR